MKFPLLFSSCRLGGMSLKNRITMAPLFLGYANADGSASELIIDHYREMASSGAAMIVVENVSVHASGMGHPFVLRLDHDKFISGIAKIASAIHNAGASAVMQINHAGRYAYASAQRLAPSAFKTGDVIPKEMTLGEIEAIAQAYADAATRVRKAGFDGVEIHGGTGYLLVQFLSGRTNLRQDEYGGSLENRMRFPLRVVDLVKERLGNDYPVGYRFLADEWLPDGLHTGETAILAKELQARNIAYLSVMAGTYDSFFLPEYIKEEAKDAYMAHFAGEIKRTVPDMTVITAGRISSPEIAERILREKTADLIGLARVLFADPQWPKKAAEIIHAPIIKCAPSCTVCLNRVMQGKPAFCAKWDKKRREQFLAMHK